MSGGYVFDTKRLIAEYERCEEIDHATAVSILQKSLT
jgi:hypothetical protein